MRKKIYNENYFETIDSEDKAYFLGFIFADGCVTNDPKKYRYQLTLKLHSKDVGILEKFIKSIDGEMNVWENKKREICEVFMSGKKIINDLEKLGVLQNKTFSVKYPKINEKLWVETINDLMQRLEEVDAPADSSNKETTIQL